MPAIIDSHVHLDFTEFDSDRNCVVRRARRNGVEAFVIPGVTRATWPRTRGVCESLDGCFAAWGLHPYFLDQHQPAHLDDLRRWLDRGDAVAVGECGLDFYLKELNPARQTEIFIAQLKLAREFDLPVIIHSRKSVDEVTKQIRQAGVRKGVMHSFNGSLQQAQKLVELGFSFGFGGPVTYPRANKLRTLVKSLPLESLLLETDAPDQPLRGHQGQRNEPARLVDILDAVAELKGQSREQIARVTRQNTIQLFSLPL